MFNNNNSFKFFVRAVFIATTFFLFYYGPVLLADITIEAFLIPFIQAFLPSTNCPTFPTSSLAHLAIVFLCLWAWLCSVITIINNYS